MNMYNKPKEGVYTVRKPDYQGNFYIEQTKVWVIGESVKSFLIQLRCAVGNHRGGDRLIVRKKNIAFPEPVKVTSGIGPNDKPVKQYDYSGAYWNN